MKLEKMKGVVTRLFYKSDAMTFGLMDANGDRVKFSTRLPVSMGETIEGLGHWHTDEKYGDEFKFQRFCDGSGAIDAEGLTYYLSHHPKFKGIGKKKAEELATKYVNVLLSSLDMKPQELAQKLMLPVETIELLQHEFAGSKSPQAIAKLCSYGVSPRQANEIVKKWGADALRVVEMNPFVLIGTIPGFAFKKTDDVARKVGFPKNHPARIEAGVKFTLEEAMDEGHTYYERGKLIDAAVELLFLDNLDARAQVDAAIATLVDRHELIMMKDDLTEIIQLVSMSAAELLTAKMVVDLNVNVKFDEIPPFSAEGLLPMQTSALAAAGSRMISVICGAAGTGKTFTIRKIYETQKDFGNLPVICAPTGKAAKRVTQLTGYQAMTIHRLLEHNGREFQRRHGNEISYSMVIVDEASMIDSVLMACLLEAMPKDCSLVLVGDPNQLPPVGPGCPFMDIINSKKFAVTTLDQVVRQTGHLRENCADLLEGKVAPSNPPSWYVIDTLDTQDDVRLYLLKMYQDMLAKWEASMKLDEMPQVLSPMSKGKLGTKELNAELQKIYHLELFGRTIEPARAGKIQVSDRIIWTKNNYELGIMNGNTGVVQNKSADGFQIKFDGEAGDTFVPNDDAGDMQLAYALTIHKSQGSEFKNVILVLHKSHMIMHDRSLIYTGATRSAKNLYLIGDRWGMKNAVQTTQSRKRRTILSRLLK